MFDRNKIEQLEQEHRERTIGNGKRKFVCREIGFSLIFFLILMTFLYFFNGGKRDSLVSYLVLLPIGILGGYLSAIWKWQDIMNRRRP